MIEKWYSHSENSMAILQKIKHSYHIPSNSNLGIYTKRIKHAHKNSTQMSTVALFIYSSKKVEIPQLSINWWMDTQIWYSHTNITLAVKRKVLAYAMKWMKPGNTMLIQRSQTIMPHRYDFIYKKCPEEASPQRQKVEYWLLEAGGDEGRLNDCY